MILDSATCHLTREVKDCFHEHNFDLLVIPGGCTKYLQPLDISVNRSFKAKLKKLYVAEIKRNDIGRPLERKESMARRNMDILIRNTAQVGREITEEVILNGWRKMKRF